MVKGIEKHQSFSISWNGIMVKGIEKHRSLIDPFSTWDRLETLESEVYKRQILTSKVNPALKDDLTYNIGNSNEAERAN